MKFFTVLSVLGLVAAATAQAQTSRNSTVASSTSTTSTSASLSPAQICIAGCARTDICCQAACVKVPCPNQAQVNATTECAAQCPQGNGTAGDTAQYASCQSSCISSYFLTANSAYTSTAGSAATNSAGSTTGGAATTTSGGGTGASSGASSTGASSTASATKSSSSSGAANHLQLGVTSAGVLGLVAMAFAL